MKKILFIAALAATVMSSCSNEDDLTSSTISNTQSNEIAFQTSASKTLTRSVTTSLSDFYVDGWTGNPLGYCYLLNEHVTLDSGTFKGANGALYWPTEGNLSFYALNVPFTDTTQGGTNSDYLMKTFTDVDGDADYVAAVSLNTAKTDVVPLTFKHILCRIGTKAVGTNSTHSYKLKSIKMNTCGTGVYTFINTDKSNPGTWSSSSSSTKDYTWKTGLPHGVSTSGYSLTESFNVIPLTTGNATFTIEYEVYYGSVKIGDYTGTNARTVSVSRGNWAPGKAINYNFYLDESSNETELQFSSSIDGWDDDSESSQKL